MDLKLHGTFGDYDLFENEGKYYALLSSTVNENASELISEKKAIEADELQNLKDNIDEAVKWADTRAMSGFEKGNQTNAIRANSFNTLNEQSHKFDDPKLVVLDGEPYLVETSDYDTLSMSDEELQRYFIIAISQYATYEQILEHKDHTIFMHDRIYYALPHGIGQLHWSKLNAEYLKEILARLIKSKTVRGVMDQIDAKFPSNILSEGKNENGTIKAVKEPVTAELDVDVEGKKCANSSKNQKTQIKIEEYRGYAIYEFENTFFARPKSSANVDFAVDDFFTRSDVFYDVSITGLREVINSNSIVN
ncbi:hypothetical protein OAN83_01700 [Alphaproteobacteria bacterium]|nr:hypothetical protein [Alphaproteobacteria bacterium]